jgi:hypothetical protein
VLHAVLARLDRTYQAFFRRLGAGEQLASSWRAAGFARV